MSDRKFLGKNLDDDPFDNAEYHKEPVESNKANDSDYLHFLMIGLIVLFSMMISISLYCYFRGKRMEKSNNDLRK